MAKRNQYFELRGICKCRSGTKILGGASMCTPRIEGVPVPDMEGECSVCDFAEKYEQL